MIAHFRHKNPNKFLTDFASLKGQNKPNDITFNSDDQTIGYYVFGRSTSDYARCYVRTLESSSVYLLNENVLYSIQPNSQFWGEPIIEDAPFDIPGN